MQVETILTSPVHPGSRDRHSAVRSYGYAALCSATTAMDGFLGYHTFHVQTDYSSGGVGRWVCWFLFQKH